MAYMVVEWVDGGGLSVINKAWLTPKKKEAFWPPCKALNLFNKIIRENDPVIENDWALHGIKRVMYETDDYEKAQRKCREAEDTSNLETEEEESTKARRRKRAKKIDTSISDESDDASFQQKKKKLFIERPPKIILQENRLMDKLSGPSNSDEHQPLKVIPGSSRCNNSRLLPLNSPRNNVSERILTSTLTGTSSPDHQRLDHRPPTTEVSAGLDSAPTSSEPSRRFSKSYDLGEEPIELSKKQHLVNRSDRSDRTFEEATSRREPTKPSREQHLRNRSERNIPLYRTE
ncbi:unnamed protein product [Ceutorhynchus assimilis]|uniref:Uncharacterized protein n=1 Tax=Ceutorhynchus assimilis TaxID=467358 RepID=A0A9N9MLI7_9CUCU|nr:unnamed protein product [Ceutorhynchus assimilis]